MMKKINYNIYILCLLLVAGLSSCKKNFLDLSPHDALSAGTFWKTEKDATMALTGCYNTLLGSRFNMDTYPLWDCYSDNAWDWNNAVNAKSAMTGPISPSTGGLVADLYNDTYGKIATCNYFLDNVDKVPSSTDQKNSWKAEVLFLRSFYYFHLSEFYGGIPLILHPYSVTDPLIKKSSKEAVVTQILGDLDWAISYLPDAVYTDGHVVKAAAILLKAKIQLYNQKYADAAASAQLIIQNNKFHLYPRYDKIFQDAGQGTDNTEIMFSVKYLSPNFENNSAVRYGWWMSVLPFQNMVDDYEGADGLPIGKSAVYNPASPYDKRDPRLNQTIMVPGSSYGFGGEGYPDWSPRIPLLTPPLKYNLRKYIDADKNSTDLGSHCQNDVVLLRYADVLLTFAEAQNEAAGPGADVYKAIDLVRSRSGMPTAESDPSAQSQSGLREKIRHERRIEFAFEGQRLMDLKRWKIADQKINAVGLDQAPTKYVFQANNYLWPFPQSEVDYFRNHGADVGQNPGY
ncbi:RagB/SusD family nutrient uptake outer membrane protein [Pedobacter sp. HMWF019]|uniref:RagB/SusD family nutrient uptake outer membrane protein n=1 Tax=Pedobacter sp. HMWF019 TaxID=2056856 RepID=UPI000D3DA078|nr:RagB/SusD family nutrient uptake outer membrane protein [Pedobacter sp. HMWF019]PTT00939.1 RagB/SusD family nutrient uptake outer membrane protein [Pedobacter sp. HMWF019]